MSDQTIVKTRKTAAALLGITPRVLGDWANEAWFPLDGRTNAGWNVPAIREARDSQGRKGSKQSDLAKNLRLGIDGERLKQSKLATEEQQLRLQQKQRELLPRRAWELFAATLLTELGDWCDQLPDLIAADVPQKQRAKVRRRLVAELDRRRRETAAELERKAGELDEGETS